MEKVGELFKSDDWKTEKHVPVIDCPAMVQKDKPFQIGLSVGKEVSHPNTTEHHIRWMQVFFQPRGQQASYQIADIQFTAHGEAVSGPNQGPAYTHHAATVTTILKESGTLFATSFCNIHGLWESSRDITVS